MTYSVDCCEYKVGTMCKGALSFLIFYEHEGLFVCVFNTIWCSEAILKHGKQSATLFITAT